jgi:hypothetical protein
VLFNLKGPEKPRGLKLFIADMNYSVDILSQYHDKVKEYLVAFASKKVITGC